MLTVTTSPSDQELVEQVRAGSSDAYRTLYQRHHTTARSCALHLARNPTTADDLVAEAFVRVLAALRAKGGPTSAFRTYLLTTLRNVAYENQRRDRKMCLQAETPELPVTEGPADKMLVNAERSAVSVAFNALPQRWQEILWYTEIQGHRRSQVAALLGLTPGGVSALAYRARAALRHAYHRNMVPEWR